MWWNLLYQVVLLAEDGLRVGCVHSGVVMFSFLTFFAYKFILLSLFFFSSHTTGTIATTIDCFITRSQTREGGVHCCVSLIFHVISKFLISSSSSYPHSFHTPHLDPRLDSELINRSYGAPRTSGGTIVKDINYKQCGISRPGVWA